MMRRWQLESGRVSDSVNSRKLYEDLVEFHWRYYSELAFQRRKIREELNSSLRNAAADFQCSRWQRVVKYKYSLDPLSAKGSLSDPGGRFNVGAIDPTRYPMFPALYLAADKATALGRVGPPFAPPQMRLPHTLRFSKILSCESRFVLSGEVAENLSLLSWRGEFEDGEQARAVVLGETTEHAEDGVQHLAGDGHEGLEFGFVAGEQGLIKGAQVGIVACCDQSRHVESATQVAVAGAAETGTLVYRGAGVVMGGVESTVRDPLAHAEGRGQ